MNHEKKLIYVLQNIRTHHKQVIDKVNEEMTQAKALLSTLRDYCEELFKKGSDVDICQERNSLFKKLKNW
jgi:predicted DNA-binding ribbon-helix-helix protein